MHSPTLIFLYRAPPSNDELALGFAAATRTHNNISSNASLVAISAQNVPHRAADRSSETNLVIGSRFGTGRAAFLLLGRADLKYKPML